MNAPLRRVGVVVFVLFALLFVNLNWVQVYKAQDYYDNEHNHDRTQIALYDRERGKVEIGNGVVLAQSVETDGKLKYLRNYPGGAEYSQVVGYRAVDLGATDVEAMEDNWLSGESGGQAGDRFLASLTGKQVGGGIVQLTLSQAAQDAAYKQLVNNTLKVPKGAIVVLDPSTGALLAAVSTPSFDPNPLVGHDAVAAAAENTRLAGEPDPKDPTKFLRPPAANEPMLNRAFHTTYAPGSTMKVVAAATALSNGLHPDSVLAGGDTFKPDPQADFTMHNFSNGTCNTGGKPEITLKNALTVSCNTAFGSLCVNQLRSAPVTAMAQAFGFEEKERAAADQPALFDHDARNSMKTVTSVTGKLNRDDGREEPAVLAQSCIGQQSVRMTPLQGALIAATVCNGGVQMKPYLVDKELRADRTTVDFSAKPVQAHKPITGPVAADLQDMMINVVEKGTGTGTRKVFTDAGISGIQLGGKTGTAESGGSGAGAGDHGWFIGFAMKDGKPIVAIAVVLENAGSFGEHGSGEAARIGGEVMKAVIKERGLG